MGQSNTQTEDIATAFNGIKSQLNSILKSNQLFHDYALLNGFLAFAHSKLNAVVLSSIDSQYSLCQSRSSSVADVTTFDYSDISTILDFSWESVHLSLIHI